MANIRLPGGQPERIKMDHGFLKAVRKMLRDNDVFMSSVKGVHLELPPNRSYPFVHLENKEVTRGDHGDVLVKCAVQVHSKDINSNEVMSISLHLSSLLDGAILCLKDKTATLKWASSRIAEGSVSPGKVVEQDYRVLIREAAWEMC